MEYPSPDIGQLCHPVLMTAIFLSTDMWVKVNLYIAPVIMSTLDNLAKQVSALAKKQETLTKTVDTNQEYCDSKFLDAEREGVTG